MNERPIVFSTAMATLQDMQHLVDSLTDYIAHLETERDKRQTEIEQMRAGVEYVLGKLDSMQAQSQIALQSVPDPRSLEELVFNISDKIIVTTVAVIKPLVESAFGLNQPPPTAPAVPREENNDD